MVKWILGTGVQHCDRTGTFPQIDSKFAENFSNFREICHYVQLLESVGGATISFGVVAAPAVAPDVSDAGTQTLKKNAETSHFPRKRGAEMKDDYVQPN